jgi:ribose/xylose/arabinose/galactoside ABC-type transport system permease subunit
VHIIYGLGAGFVVAGLALAFLGGRAISRRVHPSTDARIWIGSALAIVGAVMVVVRALLWLLVG